MSEQLKKTPFGIGLLAHVGASRREPHFYIYIPSPKTGNFSILFQCKTSVKV